MLALACRLLSSNPGPSGLGPRRAAPAAVARPRPSALALRRTWLSQCGQAAHRSWRLLVARQPPQVRGRYKLTWATDRAGAMDLAITKELAHADSQQGETLGLILTVPGGILGPVSPRGGRGLHQRGPSTHGLMTSASGEAPASLISGGPPASSGGPPALTLPVPQTQPHSEEPMS